MPLKQPPEAFLAFDRQWFRETAGIRRLPDGLFLRTICLEFRINSKLEIEESI
jgi:hypothetical protein